MELPLYQVDAFAVDVFSGNPAAIVPLQDWLPDHTMQAVAMENNVAETAFFVAGDGDYQLRWFTPTVEVDLCGHATLASAHVLFEHLGFSENEIVFQTRGGELRVSKAQGRLTLDFPAVELTSVPVEANICNALGGAAQAVEAVVARNNPHALVYVFSNESEVADLNPNAAQLLASSPHSVIATARGSQCDFVSRFFGPHVGIDEDPVTGSAHCSLVPYWAAKLDKALLQARQISPRGGDLACELRNGRVFMTGSAVTFMQGVIYLPD